MSFTHSLNHRGAGLVRLLLAVIGVSLIAACLVPLSTAQPVKAWSADPAVNTPVCTVGRYQAYPVMVSDGSGGAIVAWQDGRKATYDWDIYAQRISATGASQWTANGVPIYNSAGEQWYPAIVADGSGGAIIAWIDGDSGPVAVYAQRVNSAGALQWAAAGKVVVSSANLEHDIEMVTDGSSGAIIVWVDWCLDYGCYTGTVYAQRLNSAGTRQWGTAAVEVAVIASGGDYSRPEIKVAPDGSGGAVVAWQEYTGDQWDVRAQRISSAGVLQWAAGGIAVAATSHRDWCPVIMSDGSGGAVIAWSENKDDGTAGIRAQRVNSAGVPQWTEGGSVVFAAATAQEMFNIVLAGDGSGGAIVGWLKDTGGSDIYAQRVDSSGTRRWAAGGVAVCSNMYTQTHLVAVSDGAGGAVMAWHDERSQNEVWEIWDIYAQRVSAAGATLWASNGVAICHSAQIRTAAAIVPDGSGGAILAWNDQRTAGYENEHLYAQRVNAQGGLGGGSAPPAWDINADYKADYKDLAILGAHYGESTSSPYPAWDINRDGLVNYKDLAILGAHYGEAY